MATKSGTFTEGFIDGFQSIMGKGLLPAIPAHSIPAGKTPYQHGFEQGVAEAEGRR